jgi:MFS family permease
MSFHVFVFIFSGRITISDTSKIQEIGMTQKHCPIPEGGLTRKQIVWGLTSIFVLNVTSSFFLQAFGIAKPRMAADLNGMSLYQWGLSIPGLAAAFVTLLFSKLSDLYGRRFILMVCIILSIAGTVCSALAPTYVILIAGDTLSRLGTGALMPLIYSVLGDMFEPVQRSRWVGLLRIPQGILALLGPTMGGWFVDHMSWRHLYWMGVPVLTFCLFMVPMGIPAIVKTASRKIDVWGALIVAIASSATILGISFAGTTYPWASPQIISLLGVALLFWILFFKIEEHADEAIIDPQVFRNRTFLTISTSGLLSFVGLTAIMMYYPIYLQGVKSISVMHSGWILTPFNGLMAFIGLPAGFILAKTKRYKWMYILGYGLLTIAIFGIAFFDSGTPVFMAVLAATLAGFGSGMIPILNALVAQYAVPKRLLGASMGALYFSITLGTAIAPAILGSAMNTAYAKSLETTLPAGLNQFADKATIKELGDPKALLSPAAMKRLESAFAKEGSYGRGLFKQTVEAIRTSLQAGLKIVFLLGAVTMFFSFLLILTVPEISMDAVVEDKMAPQPALAEEPAE